MIYFNLQNLMAADENFQMKMCEFRQREDTQIQ